MEDETPEHDPDLPTQPHVPEPPTAWARRMEPLAQQAVALLRAARRFARTAWQTATLNISTFLTRLSPGQRIATFTGAALVSLCLTCSFCTIGILALPSVPTPTAAPRANAPKAAQTASFKPTVTSAPTHTAIPTVTPTVRPTATPDLVGPYSAIVSVDSTMLSKSLKTMGDACGAVDVKGCRSGAQGLLNDVHTFQADLDAHPSPACLRTVDAYLRAGLALFESAAQETIDGIDQVDPDLINQGSSDMSAGSEELDKAIDAKKAATC